MLKLFVWRGPDVLPCYGSGHVIAYAETVEAARVAVLADLRANYLSWLEWDSTDSWNIENLAKRIDFVQCEPEIFDAPVVFAIPGSE